MHLLDIAILTIMALSAVIGFFRGLTRESLGFLSWGGSFYLAYKLHTPLACVIQDYGCTEMLAKITSSAFIFSMTLAFGLWITVRLSVVIRMSFWCAVDRAFGLLFGGIRGFVFICFGYIAWISALPMDQVFLNHSSRFAKPIHRVSCWMVAVAPDFIKDYMRLPSSFSEDQELQKNDASDTDSDDVFSQLVLPTSQDGL